MSRSRFVLQNYGDKSTIHAYPAFSNIITYTFKNFGSVPDVGSLDYTNFSFNTINYGSDTVKEHGTITTIADDYPTRTLEGAWFSIHTPALNGQYYYVWYNKGNTIEPDHGVGPIGVEVKYTDLDNANVIAYKTIMAMYDNIPDVSFDTGVFETLPFENLQHISKSKVLRTIDDRDLEIFGTFQNPYDISAMVLARHNFNLFTRYRLRLYSDTEGVAENLLYDSYNVLIEEGEIGSDLLGWGEFVWGNSVWGGDEASDPAAVEFIPAANLVHWLDTVITDALSYKINFSTTGDIGPPGDPLYVNRTDIACHTSANDCHDTGVFGDITYVNQTDVPTNDIVIEANDTGIYETAPNANTQYFEISRLFLGRYIEIPYNIELGHALRWEEDTEQFRSDAGTLRSNIEVPYRVFDFNISTIPEAYRAEIQHGFRNVGLRRDFYISLFPNDTSDKYIDYSGVVKLTKIPKYTEYANNYYNSKYTMEEV